MAVVENVTGPTHKKNQSGFKLDVEIFDRMPNGEIIKGAINFWSNVEDEICPWLAPAVKGGDIVVLIGVSMHVISTKLGPFGKIQYFGSNKRRHVMVYPMENLVTKNAQAFKPSSATIFDPHHPILCMKNFKKEEKFESDISSRLEKLVNDHEEQMRSARKKFVVGIIEQVIYKKNESNVPSLIRIRTKNFVSKKINRIEQEIWVAKMQESLLKRDCRVETLDSQKNKMITGQILYVKLSDLANDAIPALKEKLKPDNCIILNRNYLETTPDGNFVEYKMRWNDCSHPEGAIQTLLLNEISFNAG